MPATPVTPERATIPRISSAKCSTAATYTSSPTPTWPATVKFCVTTLPADFDHCLALSAPALSRRKSNAIRQDLSQAGFIGAVAIPTRSGQVVLYQPAVDHDFSVQAVVPALLLDQTSHHPRPSCGVGIPRENHAVCWPQIECSQERSGCGRPRVSGVFAFCSAAAGNRVPDIVPVSGFFET